jgi:hypothetical protein
LVRDRETGAQVRTLCACLCLLAAYARAQQPAAPYDAAKAAEQRAEAAYEACVMSGSPWIAEPRPCWRARMAFNRAADAVDAAVAEEIRRELVALAPSAAELGQATARLRAYARCRARRHWWQAWKARCRL